MHFIVFLVAVCWNSSRDEDDVHALGSEDHVGDRAQVIFRLAGEVLPGVSNHHEVNIVVFLWLFNEVLLNPLIDRLSIFSLEDHMLGVFAAESSTLLVHFFLELFHVNLRLLASDNGKDVMRLEQVEGQLEDLAGLRWLVVQHTESVGIVSVRAALTGVFHDQHGQGRVQGKVLDSRASNSNITKPRNKSSLSKLMVSGWSR